MTTEDNPFAWLDPWAPRGSIQRFAVAGGFNSALFWVMWEVSLVLLVSIDLRILWGTAWGITGVLAHFVHRAFTFDNHRSVKLTLPASIPVYAGSLVGSSYTIGVLSELAPQWLRLLGLVNMLAWGLAIWLTMRVFVFRFDPSRHQSA